MKLRVLLDNRGLVGVVYLARLEVGFVFSKANVEKRDEAQLSFPLHCHPRTLAVPAKPQTTTNLALPSATHKPNPHSSGTAPARYLGKFLSFLMIDMVRMGL